jgi:hypothetical protein
MIHRIDRVNPDVDDRVIKPNEARMAINLRFGASTEDTNLSGGTLILGNEKLSSFTPPAGDNKVMGVYADLESRNVYFASYNSNGQHGLYRINANNDIDVILSNPALNFQNNDEYNVSITVVAGRLYWTDNVNEPRVVNIEKGIRTNKGATGDVYPTTWVDWHYAQIKRPPMWALLVPQLELEQVSRTFFNKTTIEPGLQYSYYYIFDNGEESRLAPYSEISWKNLNVTIVIPAPEYFYATSVFQIIKTVVIVVRNGNDGVWRELVYATTDGSNPVPQNYSFSNVLTSIKGAVSSDITDARYDSVPLVSKTNEVAQNRLNHANYSIDRESFGVNFSAKIRWAERWKNDDPSFLSKAGDYDRYSFLPWGEYSIGVEFVDNYGRTIPVSNAVDVTAPYMLQEFYNSRGTRYVFGDTISLGKTNEYDNIPLTQFFQSSPLAKYNLVAQYAISGNIPQWVNKVNIVRSKAKNIVKMVQSYGYMFLWYETDLNQSIIVSWVQPQLLNFPVDTSSWNVTQIKNSGSTTLNTFKGYVIRFNPSDTPIIYEEGMYITIWQAYNFRTGEINPSNNYYWYFTNTTNSNNDVANFTPYVKFKVSKIIGSEIYIEADTNISVNQYAQQSGQPMENVGILNLTPYSFPVAAQWPFANTQDQALDGSRSVPLSYNFTITVEKNVDDQVVYTTKQSFDASYIRDQITTNGGYTGYLNGDGFICRARKTYPATAFAVQIYVQKNNYGGPALQGKQTRTNVVGWSGNFISMSPRDIYEENWNQNIGQINLTNYKPTQPQRLENAICFSAPFIQGTQTNGLNKFNSLDFRLSPAENGPITSLVTTNATQREPGVLLAIGTYGVSSFYYDAIQLTNVDGSNNVTTTDAYLASQRPLLGQYGCSRPMSITKTPLGTVYWWSDVVNDLIRYTNAGLERLGMTFSFANYLRRQFNGNPLIRTWYDQITDEINLLGVTTATFSERYKTFQGERQYISINSVSPERAISTPTKTFYFLQGDVYVTDVNTPANLNNFIFDSYKNPEVTLVTNESPATVKRWNQVKVFGSRPKSTTLYTCVGNEQIDLVTIIQPGYYINRKGDWEAAIRRAIDNNGETMDGKLMESRIIYSKFAFDAEGFEKLNFIEVKSNVSIVQ